MTNREKYKFDYFTIEHYAELVKLAKDQGFQFILHKDKYEEGRKDVIWRHDVEFSPDIALKMAEIEHGLGVQATYFFQTHSEFYNVFEPYFTRVLDRIKELGHHIGLHFDSHYYDIDSAEMLDKYISLDKKYFEEVFNLELDTFSFHNTTPFVLSCKDYQYGGLINVYAECFKKNYQYCADSTGYWRYEILDEVLRDEKVSHLQVLTHDAMWSEEVLSPRKRVRKSIQDNAERVKDRYDEILIEFGAKNIDD
jgi:hypothetical protein